MQPTTLTHEPVLRYISAMGYFLECLISVFLFARVFWASRVVAASHDKEIMYPNPIDVWLALIGFTGYVAIPYCAIDKSLAGPCAIVAFGVATLMVPFAIDQSPLSESPYRLLRYARSWLKSRVQGIGRAIVLFVCSWIVIQIPYIEEIIVFIIANTASRISDIDASNARSAAVVFPLLALGAIVLYAKYHKKCNPSFWSAMLTGVAFFYTVQIILIYVVVMEANSFYSGTVGVLVAFVLDLWVSHEVDLTEVTWSEYA